MRASRFSSSVEVAQGINILSFNVPAGATPGDTAARFRPQVPPVHFHHGAAPDGEVEDYIATIVSGDAAGGANIEIEPPTAGTIDVTTDSDNLVIRSGAIELFRAPVANLAAVNLLGTDGDDTVNLNGRWKLCR
ncbi:MAG: GEVED domain-containing protein [Pirellulaceae bacterium]